MSMNSVVTALGAFMRPANLVRKLFWAGLCLSLALGVVALALPQALTASVVSSLCDNNAVLELSDNLTADGDNILLLKDNSDGGG